MYVKDLANPGHVYRGESHSGNPNSAI